MDNTIDGGVRMKIARYLFKSDWQSKDAATRRLAIDRFDKAAHGDDSAELLAALPRLAREDDDPGVRLATLQHLADPAVVQTMANDDADATVRSAAQAAWLNLLAGAHESAPPLEERLRLLRAQDEPRVLEHVARHAPESELRSAAMQRVTRPALLIERAIEDSDVDVRMAVLEKIEDEDQLERISERTRRSDKRISRRARDKLDSLRIARGDTKSVLSAATDLCQRMEQLLRHGDDADAEAEIGRRWAELGDHVPVALATRFQTARQSLVARRDPATIALARERAALAESIERELHALEHDLGQAKVAQHDVLVARFEDLADHWVALSEANLPQRAANERRLRTITIRLAALAARKPALRPEPTEAEIDLAARAAAKKATAQRAQETEREAVHTFEQALDTFEKTLDAGNSSAAHEAHEALRAAQSLCMAEPAPAFRKRLDRAHNRYREIAGWQRWGDNRRRSQLCEEIAALASSGLHPDAVAAKVREAQTEWASIDAVEKPATGAAGDHQARQFHKLCRLAIAPAKAYFDKRAELRQQQSQATDALLQRVEALSTEDASLRDLGALRRELGAALRTLDRVDPRERKSLAERLKQALGALDSRIGQIESDVDAAKSALIEEALALAQFSDHAKAISASRDLQRRWQAVGNGRRKRNDAQWKQFRTAIDAVFAGADAEKAKRIADAQQQREEALALCVTLESLGESTAAPERGAAKAIDDAWRQLAVSDEDLRHRYRAAHAALGHAAERRAAEARHAGLHAWLEIYRLCRGVERKEIAVADARERRETLASPSLVTVELDARVEHALAADNDVSSAEGGARDCLLELEQLAGIESPEADRQRRLDLKIARLSDRMRGGSVRDPQLAFEDLLKQWLATNPDTPPVDDADARFERAFLAISESL